MALDSTGQYVLLAGYVTFSVYCRYFASTCFIEFYLTDNRSLSTGEDAWRLLTSIIHRQSSREFPARANGKSVQPSGIPIPSALIYAPFPYVFPAKIDRYYRNRWNWLYRVTSVQKFLHGTRPTWLRPAACDLTRGWSATWTGIVSTRLFWLRARSTLSSTSGTSGITASRPCLSQQWVSSINVYQCSIFGFFDWKLFNVRQSEQLRWNGTVSVAIY